MKNKHCTLMWILVLGLVVSCVSLQASILNSIRGTITDSETGQPIPGVKITLSNPSVKYETETDDKGFVYKAGLNNGMYELKYEKGGYIPGITNIRLGFSETKDISVQLKAIKEVQQPQKVSLMSKGVELINTGKFPDAINTLTEAITATPTNPLLYYYRGFAYDKSGNPDKALEDYKKSLELDPTFLLSLSEAGKIYAKKKDLNNAVIYYKKAFELGTKDVIALYNYGSCLFNLGNNEEALKVFQKLVEIDPNYPDAYYQLGIIYMGLNDNTKAKENLAKFITMDPENENAAVAKEILGTL
ncbi:MAG TPA: tetratricopeptide repeat protein [Candidatus Deferrimicrobium sp.]|nr:tetratricopeptide repeat protein [Candidatus Kapabacteria bacterium]HLP61176.1 tetratricopeptide repeat protein [Candidatus Deferrimicrobium sp.]